MMWWGAGVFLKPKTMLEDVINSPSESTDKHYVGMDFRSEEARLWSQMEALDTEDEASTKEMSTSGMRDMNMCVKKMGQSSGMRIVSLKEEGTMSRREVSGSGMKDKSMGG